MDKTLQHHKLILSKAEVDKLSAREKKQLLMLTNMIRDMDLYRKMLVYSRKQKTGSEKLDEAILVTLVFSTSKILISKIYEIWKFLESEQISKKKASFSSNLLKQWEEIEAFFSVKKNIELFNFIRNKFGFHFDYFQDIERYIEKAMEEVGDLEFWMGSDSSGNDIFSSSNTIMLIVLRDKMIELGFTGNEEKLINQLQQLPIKISYNVNEFCKGYLTEIILKGKNFQQKSVNTISIPLLSEVALPLIVKNDLRKEQ
jgi:hypothetical protein